jgi:hypothetical protein
MGRPRPEIERAHISFSGKDGGELVFTAVEADLDVRCGSRDGAACAEFSWEGSDDNSHASGRGWAALGTQAASSAISSFTRVTTQASSQSANDFFNSVLAGGYRDRPAGLHFLLWELSFLSLVRNRLISFRLLAEFRCAPCQPLDQRRCLNRHPADKCRRREQLGEELTSRVRRWRPPIRPTANLKNASEPWLRPVGSSSGACRDRRS